MISVIIPTYHDSECLVKAIASCLVQDTPIEIIVINDDPSKVLPINVHMILSACNGKIINNSKNIGLAESRDAGIRIASGEWFLPLDTGDHLMADVLGYMLKSTPGADVVFGNMVEEPFGLVCVPPGKDGVTRKKLMERNQIWCTSLFRKDLWENVGGYTNGLHTSYEDYTFLNKCFMAGARFKYIDIVIYQHTKNPNSMLSRLAKETDKYNELARRPLML